MPLPSLLLAPLSSFRARLRRGAPLGSIRRVAEFAFESTAHLVTLRIWMASVGRCSRIAAAMLAVAGIAFVSASGALAQNCKWEAPQMCSQWYWHEVNGGTPIHLECPGGGLTCIPRVRNDMKVNGYRLQGYGFHALASHPSPGRIVVQLPVACACDVGGTDCVCVYDAPQEIPCPNLSNPQGPVTCPST
jgi:hypothetical protein